jgi:hypothetical protein
MILQCRICLDPGTEDELVRPCSCNGTIKFVHPNCFDDYQAVATNPARCPVCKFTYKYRCDCWRLGRMLRAITKRLLYSLPYLAFSFLVVALLEVWLCSMAKIEEQRSVQDQIPLALYVYLYGMCHVDQWVNVWSSTMVYFLLDLAQRLFPRGSYVIIAGRLVWQERFRLRLVLPYVSK